MHVLLKTIKQKYTMYIDLIHNVHWLIHIITVLGTCTCAGHMYRLQYNPQQLTNSENKNVRFLSDNGDLFYKHFPKDDNTTIHIIKSITSHSPIVSISRAIATIYKLKYCLPVLESETTIHNIISPLIIIRNTLSLIQSKMKVNIINWNH